MTFLKGISRSREMAHSVNGTNTCYPTDCTVFILVSRKHLAQPELYLLISGHLECILSRTKPFALWRLKCLPAWGPGSVREEWESPPCCALTFWLCRKTNGHSSGKHWYSFKGQKRYKCWSMQAPKAYKATQITKHFPQTSFCFKASEKRHFVTRSRDYISSSELRTSPQGHKVLLLLSPSVRRVCHCLRQHVSLFHITMYNFHFG